MKKTNILLMIPTLGIGGAERIVVNFANFAVQNDYNVTILTDTATLTIYKLDPRVRLSTCMPKPRNRRLIYFYRIKKMLQIKSDIIIANMWQCNMIAAVFHFFFRKKVFLYEHSNPEKALKFTKYNQLLIFLSKIFFRYANGIGVLNSEVKDFFIDEFNIPEEKIFIIQNTYPELKNKCQQSTPIAEPYLLAVGRLNKVKGYPYMLKCFKLVLEKYPNIMLVICGQGEEKDNLEKLAFALGVGEKVVFSGVVNDLIPYYQNAELLLVTSELEGGPNVVLEAMGLGNCPVVTFDCSGMVREVIKNDVNGIIVKHGDIENMANCIVNLLYNPEKLKNLKSKIPETILNYSEDRVYNYFLAIINNI